MWALPDVNVLIALLHAAHIGHVQAHQWLADNGAAGWASCPITQNGCIRIMSKPAYPGALAAADVAARLMEAAWRADAPPTFQSLGRYNRSE